MASIDELVDLIKHSKNEELQRILESKKPSDWVSNDGSTLLQLAAVYDNIDLINYLLANGHDINAKNACGNTPLLSAVLSDNFQAAKILLDADAEIQVSYPSNYKSALEILTPKLQILSIGSNKMAVQTIIPNIINNLKRSKLDVERLGELLAEANWPLVHVLSMKKHEVTRIFLEHKPLVNYGAGIRFAMKKRDYESVGLILRCGNKSGIQIFYDNLRELYFNGDIILWRSYVERLYNWQVVSVEAFPHFHSLFQIANTEYLQILVDSKIHVLFKEKFGIDLRTEVFVNKHVDAIEFFKSNNLDVNAVGCGQRAALFYAVQRSKYVQFLLYSGANVNVKDKHGRTPLFDCINCCHCYKESGQLLLEYGADVQVIDNYGMTLLEHAQNDFSPLVDFIIARLAISHVQDMPIKRKIQYLIDSNNKYKKSFKLYCQQLQKLKMCVIVKPVTLFTVLITEKIERHYRLLWNQDTISRLDLYKNQNVLHELYYSVLKTKLTSISKLHRFKCDMADVLHKITGQLFDFDHLVVKEISEYLSQRDIDTFIKL